MRAGPSLVHQGMSLTDDRAVAQDTGSDVHTSACHSLGMCSSAGQWSSPCHAAAPVHEILLSFYSAQCQL